jgi:phenylacetate-CoA ligase
MRGNIHKVSGTAIDSPIFEERVGFFRESQDWSREKLEEFQVKQLRHLVRSVEGTIPFYTEVLEEEELTWEDFTQLSDIKKFPTITKKTIQGNYDSFLPKDAKKDELYHMSTGGSTGNPLTVYMDFGDIARDKANTEHYMEVIGLDIFNYKSIRLYGDKIPEKHLEKNKYWYLDGDQKLVMSCYHVNKDTVADYAERIDEHNPTYIHTRPSAILPLAQYMISEDIELEKPIEYIIADGEYLTQGQREVIEEAFQGRVYEVYGHTEGCVFGCSCSESRLLHFAPQIGILELVDNDGSWVTEEGERGEMVTTGFNNRTFPLIRYRTGDVAIKGNERCDCGRSYTMIETVEGRMQDYVVDINDTLTPLAPAIFNYHDMNWKGIRNFKVVQETKGELRIKILREEDHDEPRDKMKDRIEKKLSQIFGNTFEIEIGYTSELPRTDIGKYRYLEQKLDTSKYF